MSKVVIIGAGQAGLEAATHLRSQGFDGEVTLCLLYTSDAADE